MNPNNFRFNSDYPIDKIIYLQELTVTTDSYGEFSQEITHGLGAIPFCKAVISFDNWQTTHQSGVNQPDPSGQVADKYFTVSSNGQKITLFGMFNGQNNKSAKIRLWGVFSESSTENISANPTLSNNNLSLNTDNNYQSLLMEGEITLSSFSQEVNHNLGFVPNVDIWYLENGLWKILDTSFSSFVDDSLYSPVVQVNETSVIFDQSHISPITNYYYRIYANET